MCLLDILALYMHIGPLAKALGPIWLPQCKHDLEARQIHEISCIYRIDERGKLKKSS